MALRFSSATGTPVFSRASAEEVGRVQRYVLDASAQQIAAVHVAGRRSKALLASWAHVVGFGPDAVVIDDEDNLRPPDGEYESAVVAGDLDLAGRRVLTDAGSEVGVLVDVEFEESSGRIGGIETNRATIGPEALVAVGPYAVIVRDDRVERTDDPLT